MKCRSDVKREKELVCNDSCVNKNTGDMLQAMQTLGSGNQNILCEEEIQLPQPLKYPRGYVLNFDNRKSNAVVECNKYGLPIVVRVNTAGANWLLYDVEYWAGKNGGMDIVLVYYGDEVLGNTEPLFELHWDMDDKVLTKIKYEGETKSVVQRYTHISGTPQTLYSSITSEIKYLDLVLELLKFNENDWKCID